MFAALIARFTTRRCVACGALDPEDDGFCDDTCRANASW